MIFSIFHLSYWESALGQFTSKKNMIHGKNFLVTCTQLYMSLYRSVHWSVRPAVITSCFWVFRAKRRADFSHCPLRWTKTRLNGLAPPVTANICSILNLKTDNMFVSNLGKLKQLQILDFLPQRHGQKILSTSVIWWLKLKTHPLALKLQMTTHFIHAMGV